MLKKFVSTLEFFPSYNLWGKSSGKLNLGTVLIHLRGDSGDWQRWALAPTAFAFKNDFFF